MRRRAKMSVEDQIFESRLGRCKHSNALLHNETCNAGVNYRELAAVDELGLAGWVRRLPCNRNRPKDDDTVRFPCKKVEYYTEAEAREYAAWEAEREAENMRRIYLVRGAILERIETTGKNRGFLDCPACKTGKVAYGRASNGHVHATCETTDCVSWME